MRLNQRTLFERREFILGKGGIHLRSKDNDGEYENRISYEDITRSRFRYVQRNGRILTTAFAFLSFGIIAYINNFFATEYVVQYALVWPLASLVLFLWYFVLKKEYIRIMVEGGSAIYMLKNKPNRQKVEQFINELYKRKKQYLREKYLEINKDGDLLKEKQKFEWLLEEEAIDEDEFKILLSELNSK